MSAADDQQSKEVQTRADLRLEQLADELHRTTETLAISLRTLRKNPGNIVFRASVEQQYHVGKLQVAAVLSFPAVAHSDDAAKIAEASMAPFIELCHQLDWLPFTREMNETCQTLVDALFGPERVAVEGRPCGTFESMMSRHARVPELPASLPEVGAVAEVLLERSFTHGQGTVSHEAFIGDMFLAFMQHVRGMSADEAKKHLTPAALIGFAQSLEKALAGYAGVVRFRIVREAGAARVVLHRATPSA